MTLPSAQPPAPLRPGLREEFLIEPGLAFLNHGSFGSVPWVVLEEQNEWRQRIEGDSIELLARRSFELLERAKSSIGDWLGMKPQDFGFVTNATEAINCVLQSLEFSAGDELLTTAHVYNAVRQAMKYVAGRAGAAYRELDMPLPIASARVIEDTVVAALGPRTRLLVIDHVTSPTALVFPIERILAACAERNIDVLVDGAHAPGMLPLNVEKLSAAYYAGNLHKWACGPKGSGFLWVRPDRQAAIHPTVISHHLGQGLAKEFSWQGSRDISGWLTVPRAIEFMAQLGWERVMAHNHAMAVWAQRMLCERWNVAAVSPLDGSLLGSMATVPLPGPLQQIAEEDLRALQQRMHDEDLVEAPLLRWGGRNYVRPCCQIYNTADDYRRLGEAIARRAGL